MLNVLEPEHPLLKKYVENIYIFEKGSKAVKYTSYPSANTSVGLFSSTDIEFHDDTISIKESGKTNHFGIAFNRLFRPVNIHYQQMVDEIAINFKPVGFSVFTGWEYHEDITDCFLFNAWNNYLGELMSSVFSISNPDERHAIIETFLVSRYVSIKDEEMLNRTCMLLADPNNNNRMQTIAKQAGVHYKYLYRRFMQYVGCSPAHYRKIVRFRNAVYTKLSEGDALRFIELCYSKNYTDQSYFTRQFRELTGESPKKFFKDISAFGHNKVVFKFY